MSARNDKKLRQVARKHELSLLAAAIKDIQLWPFKKRLSFAWSIVFPPKCKKLRVKHER